MHPAEALINARLDARQQPTTTELEEALIAVMAERNAALREATKTAEVAYGLAGWLGQLSAAHAAKDARKVVRLLDQFNAESAAMRDTQIDQGAGLHH